VAEKMVENYTKIARQVSITYFFSILVFITSPFLTSLLTRHLSIAEFGGYSIFSVTISFLIVVLDLGFAHYIVTKLSGRPQAMAERSMLSILAFFSGALLILGLIIKVLSLDTLFLSFLGLPEYGKVFNVIMVIIFLCLIFRIFNNYATSRKELEFSSIMAFVNISLWIYFLALFILIAKRLSPAIVFVMWAIGALASVIIYTIKERNGIISFLRQGKLHLDEIKVALAFGLPLVLFQTGDWLIQVADRYIIKHYATLETVGIYNLGYLLVGFVISVSGVVANVLYPYYSSSPSRSQAMKYFNIAIKYMLMLVLPALVGLFVMRSALITLISGPAYLESAKIIPWLILFPFFGSLNILLYQTMMIHNHTKFVGLVYIAAGFLNIALNIALVPSLGMKGAAISTTVCYALLFSIMAYSARRYVDIDWRYMNLKWIIIGSAFMGIVVLFINPADAIGKIATMAIGALVYVGVLILSGALSKGELGVLFSAMRSGFR
jgi:O-antigen/teichoic acid export membrane protein